MSTQIPIRHANGQRPTQPPSNGLSLTPARSPYPTSLRPSSFAALSLSRSAGRFSPYPTSTASPYTPSTSLPAAPAPTPASAFAGPPLLGAGRRRNPFEQLSEGAFDDFVGSIQDKIKRALEGPVVESPSQRRKRREEEQAQSLVDSSDVFGEIKEVQVIDSAERNGGSSSPPQQPLPSPYRKPLFPPPSSASASVVSRSPSPSQAINGDESSDAFAASEEEEEEDEDDMLLGQAVERRDRRRAAEEDGGEDYEARKARLEAMFTEAEEEREFFERESDADELEENQLEEERDATAEEEDEEELPPPFSRPRPQPIKQASQTSEVLLLSDSDEEEQEEETENEDNDDHEGEESLESQLHELDSDACDDSASALPPLSQIKPRPSSASRPRSFEASPSRAACEKSHDMVEEDEEEEEGEEESPAVEAADEATESEPLGSRIPYHLKGKGRAPTPDTPSSFAPEDASSAPPSPSRSSSAEEAESDADWDDDSLPSYSLSQLQHIIVTIQGYIQASIEEDEPQEMIELLQDRLSAVEDVFEAKLVAMNVGGSGAADADDDGDADADVEEDGRVRESDEESTPAPGMAQWSEMAPSGGEDMMVLYGDSGGDSDGEAEVDGGHFDEEPPSQADSPDREPGTQAGEGEDDLMITPSSPLLERDYDDDGIEGDADFYQDTSAFSPPRDEVEEAEEEHSLDPEEQLARQQIEALAAQLVAMDEASRNGGPGGAELRIDQAFDVGTGGTLEDQAEEQVRVTVDYDTQEQAQMDYEAISGGLEATQEQAHDAEFGVQPAPQHQLEADLVVTSEYFNIPVDSPAPPQVPQQDSQQVDEDDDIFLRAQLDSSLLPEPPRSHPNGVVAPSSPPQPSMTDLLNTIPTESANLPSFDFALPHATADETFADLLAISSNGATQHPTQEQDPQASPPAELAPVDLTSSSPPPQSPDPEPSPAPAQPGENQQLSEELSKVSSSLPAAILTPVTETEPEAPQSTFAGIFSSAPTQPPIMTPTLEEAPALPRGRRVADANRMSKRPEGAGKISSVLPVAEDEDDEEKGHTNAGDLLGVGDYGSGSEEEDEQEQGMEQTQSEDMGEVVLSDSDDEQAPDEDREGSKAPSSESISYDSRDEEDLERDELDEDEDTLPTVSAPNAVEPDRSSATPPRVQNVEEAGKWDPSTPIRFGPSTTTDKGGDVDLLTEASPQIPSAETAAAGADAEPQNEAEGAAESDGEFEIEVEMDVDVRDDTVTTLPDEVTSVRGTSAVVEDFDHITVNIVDDPLPESPRQEVSPEGAISAVDPSFLDSAVPESTTPPASPPAEESLTVDDPGFGGSKTSKEDPPPIGHQSVAEQHVESTYTATAPESTSPAASPPPAPPAEPEVDATLPLAPLQPAILVPVSGKTTSLIAHLSEESPRAPAEEELAESDAVAGAQSLSITAESPAIDDSQDKQDGPTASVDEHASVEEIGEEGLRSEAPAPLAPDDPQGIDSSFALYDDASSSEDDDDDLLIASALLGARNSSPRLADDDPAPVDEAPVSPPRAKSPRGSPPQIGLSTPHDTLPIDIAQKTGDEQDVELLPAESDSPETPEAEVGVEESTRDQRDSLPDTIDPSPALTGGSESEDELNLLVVPRPATRTQEASSPGAVAPSPPRRTPSRRQQESQKPLEISAGVESPSQLRRSTRDRSSAADLEAPAHEAILTEPVPTPRRATRSTTAGVADEEVESTAATPATPKGKSKRSRPSEAAPPSPSSATPKRRRAAEPIEVRAHEGRPPPRRHDHSHSSLCQHADPTTIAHLPVTRSHCELRALEFKSKLVSSPFLVAIPSCALASQLAQDTISEFGVIDRGPVADESGGTRLGGAGLVEGPAADDERDVELFQGDEDVLAAVRRVAGVELYDEGACELLPPPRGMSLRSPRKRVVDDEDTKPRKKRS